MKNVMLKISRLKIIVLLASVCLAYAITMAGDANVPEEPNKPPIVEQEQPEPAPIGQPEAVEPSVETEQPVLPGETEQPVEQGLSSLEARLQKEITYRHKGGF